MLLTLLSRTFVLQSYPKELLSSRDDVPDDDGCAKWIDDMLVIWVENETTDHLA